MTSIHTNNLFTTPLIVIKLDSKKQNDILSEYLPKVYAHKQETETTKTINVDPHGENYVSDTSGYTSFYTGSLLDRKEFSSLQSQLNYAIRNALKEIENTDYFNLKWMDLWYTVYGTGKNVEEHFHPNSIISGVYYLKCPENCGDIIFSDNNYNYKNYCVNLSPLKTFTYPRQFNVTPEDGMILLFPSWLNHKTQPNQSTEDKIMFAFNLVPTRRKFMESSSGADFFLRQ